MKIDYTLRDLREIGEAIRKDSDEHCDSALRSLVLDTVSNGMTRKQYDMFLSYAFGEIDEWELVKDEFRP